MDSEEARKTEMSVLPTFRQKRAFGDWIFAINCWFRKIDEGPLIDVLGKMIFMLKKSSGPNGREAGT